MITFIILVTFVILGGNSFSQTISPSGEVTLQIPEQSAPISLEVLEDRIVLGDELNRAVYLLDRKGKLLRSISGLEFSGLPINSPVQIISPNEVSIFVLDYLNQRILHLDRSLNFLAQLELDEQGILPYRFQFNPEGEMYLLDKESSTIYLLSRNYEIQELIGPDYGDYSPHEAVDLLFFQNRLLLLDKGDKSLLVFDRFGNPEEKLPLPSDPGTSLILQLSEFLLLLNLDSGKAYLSSAKLWQWQTLSIFLPESCRIIAANSSQNLLFLLTDKKTILIYSLN